MYPHRKQKRISRFAKLVNISEINQTILCRSLKLSVAVFIFWLVFFFLKVTTYLGSSGNTVAGGITLKKLEKPKLRRNIACKVKHHGAVRESYSQRPSQSHFQFDKPQSAKIYISVTYSIKI